MEGIIIINKPAAYTSFDAVAIVRGIVGEKHLGHTGTLDPNATGVLPICVGSCTRLIEYLDEAHKEYIAQAKLGLSTDTQDIWGKEISRTEYNTVSRKQLEDVLKKYKGEIVQTPSKYSAIRVNGRHLYSYAHSGENVDIPSRKVNVYELELLDFNEAQGSFSIRVSCSRGTYIRSICNDVGIDLGCGAVLTSLTRTKACGFDISQSVDLDYFRTLSREDAVKYLCPVEKSLSFMNRIDISEAQKKDFRNGKHLKADQKSYSSDEPVAVFCNDILCGIGEWDNPNRIKPRKVLIK